jgi:hypothetical protein
MNMKPIHLVVLAVFLAGCGTTKTGDTGYSPGSGSGVDFITGDEKADAVFSGGDGSSLKQAVIVGAAGEKQGIRAEYIWLHGHYPHYTLKLQSLRGADGHAYDKMDIVTADGQALSVFFDITPFFGK